MEHLRKIEKSTVYSFTEEVLISRESKPSRLCLSQQNEMKREINSKWIAKKKF